MPISCAIASYATLITVAHIGHKVANLDFLMSV